MIGTIILIAISVILIGVVIGLYNSLVRLRNEVENSWAQIDVQLKRRTDLIPNLINTVKGYMKHERELLENITKARSALIKADSVKDKAKAENQLENTLKSLFAVSENYPQLKANENFMKLQEELSSTENKIAYARQHYNDMAMYLNNKVEQFPSNIIASLFGFKEKEFFEVDEKDRKPVKVDF